MNKDESSGAPNAVNLPTQVQQLKVQIAESYKEIEKLKAAITEYRNLPIVHQSLQGRIRNLARAFFFLQLQFRKKSRGPYLAKQGEILKDDLKALSERKAEQDAAKKPSQPPKP